MGQAKNRGTYEERRAQAIARNEEEARQMRKARGIIHRGKAKASLLLAAVAGMLTEPFKATRSGAD